MNDLKKYNLFIFVSTIARSVTEIFSVVFLYERGVSLRYILLFQAIFYLIGMFTSYLTMKWLNKIGFKLLLLLSSILLGLSFWYLQVMKNGVSNLIILALMFGISSYIYHTLRHYYALTLMNKDVFKNIRNIIFFNYLANTFAPYLGAYLTNHFSKIVIIIVIMVISIIANIFLIFIKDKKKVSNIKITKVFDGMRREKNYFFAMEQFKVIFVTLQPLYLYLYVDQNIEYIGIFNILLAGASLIFIYFGTLKLKPKYYFGSIIIFSLILMLKINLANKYYLLVVGFFEGLFLKLYETISTRNMYNRNISDIESYVVSCEFIFCFSRVLISLVSMLLELKIMLYLSIAGIVVSGFIIKKSQRLTSLR